MQLKTIPTFLNYLLSKLKIHGLERSEDGGSKNLDVFFLIAKDQSAKPFSVFLGAALPEKEP